MNFTESWNGRGLKHLLNSPLDKKILHSQRVEALKFKKKSRLKVAKESQSSLKPSRAGASINYHLITNSKISAERFHIRSSNYERKTIKSL